MDTNSKILFGAFLVFLLVLSGSIVYSFTGYPSLSSLSVNASNVTSTTNNSVQSNATKNTTAQNNSNNSKLNNNSYTQSSNQNINTGSNNNTNATI